MDLNLLKDDIEAYLLQHSLRLSLIRSQKDKSHCNRCGSTLYSNSYLHPITELLNFEVNCQAQCGFQLTMMMKVPDSIIRKLESKIKVKEIVEAMRTGEFPDPNPDEPPLFKPTD